MFLQALDLEALKVVNGLERNTINEDEFLLLSEEIESKNPENRVTVFMLFLARFKRHFCPNLYAWAPKIECFGKNLILVLLK